MIAVIRVVIAIIKDALDEPCTLWPNKWKDKDWSHCCEDHDEDYEGISYDKVFFMMLAEEMGVPYDARFKRWLADMRLRRCVNKVLPKMGDVMYCGVRIFGWIAIKLEVK